MAVGRGHACIPSTDITGIAAVREHFPKPDRSFIKAIFFIAVNSFQIMGFCYQLTIYNIKCQYENTQFLENIRGQF